MKAAVLGLWHLGCVCASGCAALGFRVVGWDADPAVVGNLAAGEPSLFEPGLKEQIRAGLESGNLCFESDPRIALVDADVAWVTYDVPVDEDDIADCDFVFARVAQALPWLKKEAVVVVSSQLPVGSVAKMEVMAAGMGRSDLDFACAPENLRLGRALEIFAHPDRIVCGVRSERAKSILRTFWAPVGAPVEWMGVEAAEMTKHAINAFLAVSVTFANEIASICELTGADAKEVERGLKTEARIGPKAYLSPGLSFAGGTLARDVAFLSALSAGNAGSAPLLAAVKVSNDRHGDWVINALKRNLGDLEGRTIALWGLTYKPGTSALRRSPSLACARQLSALGARVKGHDPAIDCLPAEWNDCLTLAASPIDAAAEADALVQYANWDDYARIEAGEIMNVMKQPLVIDPTRFLFASLGQEKGFKYVTIGGNPYGGRGKHGE
ncbi:MAG: nucleotide sugar dehydrogenase [Planctomycetota bacterium]|jgi:UDPglucose 6-dehydrogenase|nr:nucleotide sugar dehydrogenase [Planctomycetota bacterium]